MTSNDLLSYSIMYGGDKVVPLVSTPLFRELPSLHHVSKQESITLPPINNLGRIPNAMSTFTLTENNLMKFRDNFNSEHSAPPSLTSSSSVSSISPVSSPKLSKAIIEVDKEDVKDISPAQKRRQRMGPSCDSCRTRKIKCNAEITILCKIVNNEISVNPSDINLTNDQINDLIISKQPIILSDHSLLVSNSKIIRFRGCTSCVNKKRECCFSKGFTKEDIMSNKKISDINSHTDKNLATLLAPKKIKESKIMKKKSSTSPISNSGSRKSSCISCRKRKVKCVYNDLLNKCEGCFKKNHDCSFYSAVNKTDDLTVQKD